LPRVLPPRGAAVPPSHHRQVLRPHAPAPWPGTGAPPRSTSRTLRRLVHWLAPGPRTCSRRMYGRMQPAALFCVAGVFHGRRQPGSSSLGSGPTATAPAHVWVRIGRRRPIATWWGLTFTARNYTAAGPPGFPARTTGFISGRWPLGAYEGLVRLTTPVKPRLLASPTAPPQVSCPAAYTGYFQPMLGAAVTSALYALTA